MTTDAPPRNLVLTGVPRGGTTLTCHLLNELPNVVALVEPMDVNAFVPFDDDANVRLVGAFFEAQRASLLTEGRALGQSSGGRSIDNPLSDERDPVTGKRVHRMSERHVVVQKPLAPSFTLAVKHPVAFTALLPLLAPRFECFATVRNPLAALMSWCDTPFPVANGHAPAAERLDADLTHRLACEDDLHERQITLLSWFFERFRVLAAGHVIRYEEVIASRGAVLPERMRIPHALAANLESRNGRSAGAPLAKRLAHRLVAREGAYLDHYSPEDILASVEP
jgi:hypothetical protein